MAIFKQDNHGEYVDCRNNTLKRINNLKYLDEKINSTDNNHGEIKA